MTHGTDRDRPMGDARDDDPADDGVVAGADGVTDDGEQAAATDEPAPTALADDAAGTGDAPAGDADDVPESSSPTTNGPVTDDRATGSDGPAGRGSSTGTPTGGPVAGGPSVTARPRPPALPPSEPAASWPSWEDVAVTAPPTVAGSDEPEPEDDEPQPEPDQPQSGGSGAAAPAVAASRQATSAAGPADALTPGSGTEESGTEASGPTASAAAAAAARRPEGDAGDGPAGAGPAQGGTGPAQDRGPAPAPLPPLDLGGLSALAFAALNAASVGKPAHAVPPAAATPPADPPQDGGPVAPGGETSVAAGPGAPESGAPEPAAPEPGAPETAMQEPGAPETAVQEPGGAPSPAPDAEPTPADGSGAPAVDAARSAPADAAPEPGVTTAAAPVPADEEAPGPDGDVMAAAPAPGEVATPTTPQGGPSDGVGPQDLARHDDGSAAPGPAAAAQAPEAAGPVGPAGRAAETVVMPPARADETAVMPPTRADETAVVPPVRAAETAVPPARADETAVVPPARADETVLIPPAPGAQDVATRATPLVPSPAGPPAEGPDADAEPSLLDEFEAEEHATRWPRVAAIVGGAVVLLVALYVGASYAVADRVPRGATVAGVEIGGLSSAQARQALTDGLAERTTSAVPVVAQDVQAELDPQEAGLVLDAGATVDRLTGVALTQPVRLWRQLVGVGEQRPVTEVDEAALGAAVEELTGSLTLAPVDGTVVFADGAAHTTAAAVGWELDTAGAAAVLEDGWLTAARPLELPTAVVEPAVSDEETEQALQTLAAPLAAAPVTVRVADQQAVIDVATLTANAAVVPVEGALRLQLDGEALSASVLEQLPDLLQEASDAKFEFQDGSPVIVPGTPGTTLDPTALAAAVAQAATADAGRVAAVELVQSDPAETTAALEALGVKEVVSEFSTPLTSEPRRTGNIANGLAKITGTLVRPGETFSLTEALGPVDAAHGFVQAGAIVNGEHKDAWGGGLSQVSTTTFNAAYFAGFEDVEHTPHSEWFQRYPEGREATIFTGVIDMKWKNTSPYGALVQGYVADGRAWVRIWSTKHFTVETEKSGRSNVVAPTTVYSQSPTCEPQGAGNPGFTVTNTRKVYLAGELVDTDTLTWRYKPQNKVVCGSAPAPGAPTP